MDLSTHFSHRQPLRAAERELVRRWVKRPGVLDRHALDALRYALALAQLGHVRTRNTDVDVFEVVAPYRHWLIEQLAYFVQPGGEKRVDWKGIRQLLPSALQRARAVRSHLLENGTLSRDRLERELTQKQLVLILGGGGGSGYAHLGALGFVSDLGLTPNLIVGASMGALIGLFRAERQHFDPVTTALALPRPSEWSRVFSPYRGVSRFGFPGTIELKARALGTEIFERLIGRPIPRISELAIPYRAVVTGLRTGIGLALSDVERRIERNRRAGRTVRVNRNLSLFVGTVRKMLENPRLLEEIVFGGDEGLLDVNAVDAMGFSCAVPGIIHYDVHEAEDPTARRLRELFAQRQIFRLTDGGVVSNVPARVAYQTVARGDLGYRNAFFLAFDAFAPVINQNAMFVPIQQLVRRSVLVNRPYCDHLVTLRQPPPPFQLLQSLETLQRVMSRTRKQLESERPFVEAMMRPLPRWAILERALDLPSDALAS